MTKTNGSEAHIPSFSPPFIYLFPSLASLSAPWRSVVPPFLCIVQLQDASQHSGHCLHCTISSLSDYLVMFAQIKIKNM